MIYAAGVAITTTVAQPAAAGGEQCAGQFPDLTREDLQQLANIRKPFINRTKYPARYEAAKGKLIAYVRDLQTGAELPGQTGPDKLRLIARLVDFDNVMVMLGILPSEFLPRQEKLSVEPQVYRKENISAGLSPELKELLGDFLAGVNREVRNVFLVGSVMREIKLYEARDNGANEPLTRSIVVDNSYELFEQAAVIVHEAGHLEYTYRFANEPKMQNKSRAELFADLKELAWFDSYLERADLSEGARQKAAAAREKLRSRISDIQDYSGR